MSVTIEDVVQDALGVLGEVTGVGTQLYSEPRMIKDAGRAFNMLFKKHWWKNYTVWTTLTLDGVNGVATTSPFTQVIDFDDFAAVHRAGVNTALPTLPEKKNPNTLSGTTPQFWTSLLTSDVNYAGKKIKIYPVTSTGNIDVRARFHPLTAGSEWANATIVDIDRDLLVYGTAYMALSGDDLNPGAKMDVQSMMDGRYKDIQNSLANQRTSYAGEDDIPRQWFETP